MPSSKDVLIAQLETEKDQLEKRVKELEKIIKNLQKVRAVL